MTSIKLNKLTIRNFKGFKEFVFEPNGQDVNVSGDNGTGKTSIYDAFLWLLFGKDSTGATDFDWKPLDKDGKEINHLETSVTGVLEIDGKEKVLSRTIKEVWSKTRGSAVETFSKHTTVYQLDDLNVKQKEFNEFLAQYVDEETFRVLTNIHYFPQGLDVKKRRAFLVEMIGDLSNEAVIASNESISFLTDVLGDKQAENLLKTAKQKKTEVNDQLKTLPGRIDEVDRSLPDISNLDKAKLEADKAALEAQVAEKQKEIASVSNGLAKGTLEQELRNFELDYKSKEQEYLAVGAKKTEELKVSLAGLSASGREVENEVYEFDLKMRDLRRQLDEANRKIETNVKETEDLRVKFSETKARTMPDFDTHQTECPTCGQGYPDDKQAEIRANYQKEVEEFNLSKASELESINIRGKAIKAEVETLELKKADLEMEIDVIDAQKDQVLLRQAELHEEMKALSEKIASEESQIEPFANQEAANTITAQIDATRAKIKALDDESVASTASQQSEIDALNARISTVNDDLYQFVLYDRQSNRKDELIEEEKALSVRYGQLDNLIFALEEFIRTKVGLLTDSINAKFNLVEWQLFKTQLNGGLQETCEAVVEGVRFNSTLNTAGRINAGLDIVDSISKHKGIQLPVFVDNAESINELIPIDSQRITLSVSKYKTLRVEKV